MNEPRLKAYCNPSFQLIEVDFNFVDKDVEKAKSSLNLKAKAVKHLNTFFIYDSLIPSFYDLFVDNFNKSLAKELFFSISLAKFYDPAFHLYYSFSDIDYKILKSPKSFKSLSELLFEATKNFQKNIDEDKNVKSFYFLLNNNFYCQGKNLFSVKLKFRRIFPYD